MENKYQKNQAPNRFGWLRTTLKVVGVLMGVSWVTTGFSMMLESQALGGIIITCLGTFTIWISLGRPGRKKPKPEINPLIQTYPKPYIEDSNLNLEKEKFIEKTAQVEDTLEIDNQKPQLQTIKTEISDTIPSSEITTLNEARQAIKQAINSKKPVTLTISLDRESYDSLASEYHQLQLYLTLPVVITFPELHRYKSYFSVLEALQNKGLIKTTSKDGQIQHTIEVNASECYYKTFLSQTLNPISRKVLVTYRGSTYSFSEFKSAVFYYKTGVNETIEQYFSKNKELEESKSSDSVTPSQKPINEFTYSLTGLNFVAIDFETANEKRHSACSLGMVEVKDGQIVNEHYYKFKPEPNVFSSFNSRKHRMKAEDVENEPTFKESWPELKSIIQGNLILAHNAGSFDIHVLRQSLEYHGLEAIPYKWGCSMRAAEKLGLPKKLNELCSQYSISLNHHDALSDARACAQIAIRLYQQTGQTSGFDIREEVAEKLFEQLDENFREEHPINDLDREFINRIRR